MSRDRDTLLWQEKNANGARVIELDNLIAHMVARNVQRVVMDGDVPMKLHSENGEASGPVVAAADLAALVTQITPENMRVILERFGKTAVAHRSPHGSYNVTIVRKGDALQVTVAPVSAAGIRLGGVALAVCGIGLAWLMGEAAHKTGRFSPAFLIIGPVISAMGLNLAIFGETLPTDFKEMKPKEIAFLAIGLIAGFTVYGFLKNGLI